MENENVTTSKKGETKLCKHCQSEMPKKAKVCPTCRRKQGGAGKWIIIGIVVFFLFVGMFGGSDTNSTDQAGETTQKENVSQDVEKDVADETKEGLAADDEVETTEAAENVKSTDEKNEFVVGDVVETDSLKISYVSAGEYVSDNQFLTPKEGHVYYRLEFEVENISDIDQSITSWSFEGYADGYAVDEAYVGDDTLSATLSPDKKAKGAIYYEVPADAQEVIAEYETDFWTQGKIAFIVK